MARHHIHWNTSDVKWLAAGAFVLWLVTRPKQSNPPAMRPTDDYEDANGVTWSLEQPDGAALPVPYWIGQATDGYAGHQLGPFASAIQLRQAIDKYAAEHK